MPLSLYRYKAPPRPIPSAPLASLLLFCPARAITMLKTPKRQVPTNRCWRY